MKDQLIRIYKEKEGKKGCFENILSHYHDKIVQLYDSGFTVAFICEYIQEDLNFNFTNKKNPARNQLERNIRDYVAKLKKERNEDEEKTEGSVDTPVSEDVETTTAHTPRKSKINRPRFGVDIVPKKEVPEIDFNNIPNTKEENENDFNKAFKANNSSDER